MLATEISGMGLTFIGALPSSVSKISSKLGSGLVQMVWEFCSTFRGVCWMNVVCFQGSYCGLVNFLEWWTSCGILHRKILVIGQTKLVGDFFQ